MPRLSVIIPTYNEADNVPELFAQLVPALADIDAELIFVDDSTDKTCETVDAVAALYKSVAVRVHHRSTPDGGLGGAVVEGLRLARGGWIVVLDADLQHPPALVPDLLAAGEMSDAQLVVASRYVAGGDRSGLDGGWRRFVSSWSTRLAKVIFPLALRRITDPMSGFFAVRRDALDLDGLRPLGYKILLELVVSCRLARVTEVPYTFRERHAGESKSTLREGFRFLRHLASLRLRTRSNPYTLTVASGVADVPSS